MGVWAEAEADRQAVDTEGCNWRRIQGAMEAVAGTTRIKLSN